MAAHRIVNERFIVRFISFDASSDTAGKDVFFPVKM
jgi:hypothetical protein